MKLLDNSAGRLACAACDEGPQTAPHLDCYRAPPAPTRLGDQGQELQTGCGALLSSLEVRSLTVLIRNAGTGPVRGGSGQDGPPHSTGHGKVEGSGPVQTPAGQIHVGRSTAMLARSPTRFTTAMFRGTVREEAGLLNFRL